ncbi:hypothetical protein [Phocoenobacter skyensis]|nr:hypothetical protein [Pasteurella skyensis]MDP8184374.1 hypothetical protein [Pasteurella skyensis]
MSRKLVSCLYRELRNPQAAMRNRRNSNAFGVCVMRESWQDV